MEYYRRNYPARRMSRGYSVDLPYDEYNSRYNSRSYGELPPYGYPRYGGKRKTRKHRTQSKKSRKHSRRRKN